MNKRFETVAFDLGGVLAYRDLSVLSKEELFLLDVYMKRNSGIYSKEIIEYAQSKILAIYLKMYKLYPHTFQTFYMLNSEGLRPSIWTNNIKEIDNWLEEVGLYRYLDRKNMINSFNLGVDKPNKDFYMTALKLLQNEPKDVLFIDDSLKNVVSARECGIESSVFNDGDDLVNEVLKEVRKK